MDLKVARFYTETGAYRKNGNKMRSKKKKKKPGLKPFHSKPARDWFFSRIRRLIDSGGGDIITFARRLTVGLVVRARSLLRSCRARGTQTWYVNPPDDHGRRRPHVATVPCYCRLGTFLPCVYDARTWEESMETSKWWIILAEVGPRKRGFHLSRRFHHTPVGRVGCRKKRPRWRGEFRFK